MGRICCIHVLPRATQLGKNMTDQELNLKCAKYLWPDELPKNIVEDYGTYYIDTLEDSSFEHEFSPATDANDALLVFDKLIKDWWEFMYYQYDGCHSISFCHGEWLLNNSPYRVSGNTIQEANRSVLEKIMTINGSD